MISHHDPERTALLDARSRRMDALWRRGVIGDSTYLRSLFIDGVDAADARSRLACLKMDITPGHEARRLEASRQWVEGTA